MTIDDDSDINKPILDNPTITYKIGEGNNTLDGIILSRPLAKNILDRIVKFGSQSFIDGFICGFLCGIATACVIMHPHRIITHI